MSIPAVAYYRMSTDKQEASIPAQRTEVEAYAAKHGYHIIREYLDEGISGDATEKRSGFQQMRRDAQERGDFRVILCWDQDRFGRFDTLEAGYWIKPFRDADIRLETVALGKIDWNDVAGRIIYAVQQEGKHAFLRDLSRNVIRGQLAAIREGKWLGGPVPYGYDLVDHKLVLGNPEKVAAVRWIFTTYADTDTSVRSLAHQLNERGIAAPVGGQWRDGTVHRLLQRPTYKGDTVWNRRHDGKYFGVFGGQIAPQERGGKRRITAPEEWVLVPDTHPALVDRQTFDKVQARLKNNRGRTAPLKGGGDFIFSKLIYCGNCGSVMYGSSKHTLTDKHGLQHRRYICGTYHAHGRGACSCNVIVEDMLLSVVLRKLQEWFQDTNNKAALEAEIRNRLTKEAAEESGEQKSLEVRIKELDRQINQGTERMLTIPADLADLAAGKLREWREQRHQLQAKLDKQTASPSHKRNVEDIVRLSLGLLESLNESIQAADPKAVRVVLREVVSRVECWFDPVPFGPRRKRGLLSCGVISVRPDAILTREVARDRPLMIRFRAGNMPAIGSIFIAASVSRAPLASTSLARSACSGG
jgi:DNA invertase Pin-like site-specific DNA recombinase